MNVAVLGPIELRAQGRPVALTRPKSLALLGLLAVRANRDVAPDRLVHELWLDQAPPSAPGALRVHVAHLRRALRGATSSTPAVISGPHGYRLSITPAQIDAAGFEADHRVAREAAAEGSMREAADRFERALARWRGPAYDGLHDYLPIAAEARRLEELRLAAITELAEAYLALGRADDACELLAPVFDEHPMHEGVAEGLMRALYRGGRPVDALRTFGRLRQTLDQEIGVAPGPGISELEESIVLRRPELDAPRGAGRPSHTVTAERLPFVGRRAELAALAEQLEQAAAHGPRLAVVRGPGGVGKRALVETFAARAAARGTTSVWARCPGPAAEAGAERDELDAMARDLDGLADSSTVLVLEDAQWAERETVARLEHLCRVGAPGLLLVAVEQVDGPGARVAAPPRGRLDDPDLLVELDGLDLGELEALVEQAAPEPLRARLVAALDELHELTAGYPAFVRETLRALVDAPPDLPLEAIAAPGVEEQVQRRLAPLSTDAVRTLGVAAVLGHEFSLPLVAETAAIEAEVALTHLETAAAAGLVVEAPELDHFAFRQRLVRNALYRGLLASRRARLHLRAATYLERALDEASTGSWAQVAHHRVAALPLGDLARAATCARRAGDVASGRASYGEATRWYSQALALADDAGWARSEQGETLITLGVALERSGDRRAARFHFLQAAELARQEENADLLADVAIAATPRYVVVDDFHPTQVALVDEALAALGDDPRRRVWLLCSGSAAHYYEDAGDQPYAAEALALARSSSDPEVRATGLLTYHRWLTHDPHATLERLALSRELLALGRETPLPDFVSRGYRATLIDLLGIGEATSFAEHLAAYEQFASEAQIPADRYWSAAFRATRRLMVDPSGEAEELVRAARRVGRELQQSDAEGTFMLQMFALRYQQRRVREVTPGLEAPDEAQPRMLAGLSLLAAALVEAARPDEARKVLDRAVVDGELRLPADNLWLGAAALYGGVAAAVGTAEQRAVMEAVLAPFADAWCVFGAGAAVFGTGHHWLGRLATARGDIAGATAHLEAARDRADAAGSAYWSGIAEHGLERITAGD